jgi:hypothetical protein
MMVINSALTLLAVIVVALSVQQISFAMHDSTLGVNSWLARDNSTQLHTINLNGPVNQSAAGPIEPPTAAEEETVTEADEVEEEDEEVVEDGADEEVASDEEAEEEDEEEEDE